VKLSVIVPCFNEAQNIHGIFDRINNSLSEIDWEVVFVNDGSTDATLDFIEVLVSENPAVVKLIKHESNRGIHESWMSGLEQSKGDLVCLMDADLQYPPEAIKELMRAFFESSADVVQGARRSIGKDEDRRMQSFRIINFWLNIVFRIHAKDGSSTFILAPRDIMTEVLTTRRKYRFFQTFLHVSAMSKGYKVSEIETLFSGRYDGKPGSSQYEELIRFCQVLVNFRTAIKEFLGPKSFILEGIKPVSAPDLPFWRRVRFEFFFLTMPLHKWIISRNARSYYLWLKRTEYLTTDQIQELQLRRLKLLLRRAYQNVPYYKRIFDDAEFNPFDIKTLADIRLVPLTEKQDVRDNIHFSMFAKNHNKKYMHRIKTSGSTGEPFICYADKFQLEMRFASTIRAFEMAGWKFGDKQLRLWHQTLGMTKSMVIREKIDALFMRRKFVPAFEMTEKSALALVKEIETYEPVLIDGYAESLNFIASAKVDGSSWRPRAIVSSAQQLTPETRNRVQSMFGSLVLDKYGSREFSGIAYQCLSSNFHHVQDESYIVELLVNNRPALPGEIGEIVVTDLNNLSTPLIRYRIGDLAVAVEQTDCPCRRPHSLIGDITGRTQALVACTNGVWLPGTFFAHFFKDFEYAVKKYQIIQEVSGEFSVSIIPTTQFTPKTTSEILDGLSKYVGDTKISINLVDQIALLSTGKRTPVFSKVRLDFQDISNESIIRNLNL
jgi:phenylacetate-CoA ligase